MRSESQVQGFHGNGTDYIQTSQQAAAALTLPDGPNNHELLPGHSTNVILYSNGNTWLFPSFYLEKKMLSANQYTNPTIVHLADKNFNRMTCY